MVLVGSYNWMLSILRPPPSVAAWIALFDTANSFGLDGAFDYLVEHMMLLVSCVYAASQGSEAFFFTSLFAVLISSYIWIQPVLRLSPSVTPRRMTSKFLNCKEPFRIRRGLKLDTLRSSSEMGLEVSYHGIGSTHKQDHGIETHRPDVVKGIALEADGCDTVPRPPPLEIEPDIFTADIQCADVCVNTCDTVPHLPLLEIDPDIFTGVLSLPSPSTRKQSQCLVFAQQIPCALDIIQQINSRLSEKYTSSLVGTVKNCIALWVQKLLLYLVQGGREKPTSLACACRAV